MKGGDVPSFFAYGTERELLREGSWPENGRGTLTLPQLPNGYYTLEVSSDKASFAGSRSFAVVPDPAKRPANPEMFFAIDSGQSWLARPDAANFRQPPNAYEVAAKAARRLGLGLNAGHDLSLVNLNYFYQNIPWLDEVSIGHALISDALYLGLQRTIQEYKNCLRS